MAYFGDMKRTYQALLLAVLMATMSLAGCFGSDDEESDEDETPVETLEDWQVHFANSVSDLPECNDDREGWLYYISMDENFRVCTQFGWEIVDITGPSGDDGQDGTSILINVVNSTGCLNGGNTFEIGSDQDGNGVLDVTEVEVTLDICNGAEGPAGSDGEDGENGQDGSDGLNAIISTTPESSGSNCANGGTRIDVGVDDNSNAVLETSEIDQTQYVCDGGSSNNTMLSTTSAPNANLGCDAGGLVISHGFDNGDGGGIYANGALETGEIDSEVTFCSRFVTQMVKEVNSEGSSHGRLGYDTTIGNTLFFSAYDPTHGRELWKTDGTAMGTMMVKDINSGNAGSHIYWNARAVGNTLYFSANDGVNGYELWKSDGTATGTVMVKDINSGSGDGYPSWFTTLGNTLYFSVNDGVNGDELWKSDGTNAGTVMVKDINNGASDSYIAYMKAVGNTLYFRADDGTYGDELWVSDGTASGTVMIRDINIDPTHHSSSSRISHFSVIGNTTYFQADDGINGLELWKSDGTTSGTVMVKDINSGNASGLGYDLTAIGNTLYFSANDGIHGYELWKSDGTASGTVMVKDIYNGSDSGGPFSLEGIGDMVFFNAFDETHGLELWKSDGTASGTVMVKDICNGSCYGIHIAGSAVAVVGNTLYFQASDNINGFELWKSDGTASGTVMVKDIMSGSQGSYPQYMLSVGDTLFFTANDGTRGYELYSITTETEITYS